MNRIKHIPIICGPTASGKSSLAFSFAKASQGIIINADSMQIYKHLNIGTAKPPVDEINTVEHFLLDFLDLDVKYSVSDYIEDVSKVLDEQSSMANTITIVGGTPQYIQALTEGIRFIPNSSDATIRAEIDAELREEGGEALLEKLSKVDPEKASQLHPNDHKRIGRALEIYYVSGQKQSEWDQMHTREKLPYDFDLYAINWEREELYSRINKRVDIMISNGLLEEAKALFEMDLPLDATALQAIGYKEIFPYFKSEESLEDCIETLKRNSRRYAKRQLTWYRKMNIHWFKPDEMDYALNRLLEVYT